MEPQLFNLEEDPGEINDLAADPGYRTVRNDLVFEVLEEWDPDAVALEMAEARSDLQVMKSWAQNVQPPDTYRWSLRPEMSYLDQLGNEGGQRSDQT
jgi:choline-sulfatase